jgi:hypothetical protein
MKSRWIGLEKTGLLENSVLSWNGESLRSAGKKQYLLRRRLSRRFGTDVRQGPLEEIDERIFG